MTYTPLFLLSAGSQHAITLLPYWPPSWHIITYLAPLGREGSQTSLIWQSCTLSHLAASAGSEGLRVGG